jgi:DNA-binding protein HU-beta
MYPSARPYNIRSAKLAESEGMVSGPGSRINKKQATKADPPRSPRRAEEGVIMKKKELIERIAEVAGVPKSEAQKHFEAFEEVVTEALKAGEEIQITGFGKFSVKERKAREGTNPQTGQKMRIAASRVPSFSAGNALKEAV